MAGAGVQQSGQKRWLILTFDDGPEPGKALELILDTLGRNQIFAEFYVIGSEVAHSPDKAKLIVARGHKIQNHSWSHPNLAKESEADVREELKKTQRAVKEATGVTPTKVRPPYGAGGWPGHYDPELAKVARELALEIENWDIDTEDWKNPQGLGKTKLDKIHQQLTASKRSHLVVLLHVQPGTARDLPNFIERVKEWGFGFAHA